MVKKTIQVPQMRGVQDLLTINEGQTPTAVSIERINANPKQPRRWFDPAKMAKLVESVQKYGILEPLLVRPDGFGDYELIAGERRLRAAIELGHKEVPIVSQELSDEEALSISILENLQREDLNPLEEVEAILALLALNLKVTPDTIKSILNEAANQKKRKLDLTENVSRQLEEIENLLSNLGKFTAESFRTSRLPLLNLPTEVLETLRKGQLEYTKARAIARVKSLEKRTELLERAIKENLSLTQIKELIQQLEINQQKPPERVFQERYSDLGRRLTQAGVWKDTKKYKKLEKLLNDLEQFLSET
ncbi:ParB/RepB/Spo0J family partition protein [Merismopedia glauca]|uniref:Chromosome partitioning protein ParB n=1 Tax=Merismopedia glauca CCAP 1448/3 TaxID=1296344 RepID=A0A2T1BZM3_9CYAN|nr:ParB/RepB/Spo0J family partition protein [Merismopedia glauca]PSB01404.1 chromosome partitioning protein ParB [Merismopedia glauca CCAP 1448/3]